MVSAQTGTAMSAPYSVQFPSTAWDQLSALRPELFAQLHVALKRLAVASAGAHWSSPRAPPALFSLELNELLVQYTFDHAHQLIVVRGCRDLFSAPQAAVSARPSGG